jgi:hypothetical protein
VEGGRIHLPEAILDFIEILQMFKLGYQVSFFVKSKSSEKYRIDYHGGECQKPLDPKRDFRKGLPHHQLGNPLFNVRLGADFWHSEVHCNFLKKKHVFMVSIVRCNLYPNHQAKARI